MSQTQIGVIGCGNISKAYFKACKQFPVLNLLACADLDITRAQAMAKEFNIPRAVSVDELLNDPEVQIVINLTIPKAHAEVDMRILESGKHAFSEKPFSLTLQEGKQVMAASHSHGLRVGCAPDTVLGAGIQTCRKLIDEGAIGTPVAATANMLCGGHETWHPSPEFYYEKGGGPMFDMGPYYLHALITMIGPVRRVTGSARITFPERTITSQPKHGNIIKVEVPTHISAVLDFANGAICNFTTSFDIKGRHSLPCIKIYGSEGTLQVPDPNGFGGQVRIGKPGSKDWEEIPLTHPYHENSRGLGVADMATAIASGRKHRANGEVALHAVDIMESIHTASESGRYVELTTTCERPAAMVAGLPAYTLDS